MIRGGIGNCLVIMALVVTPWLVRAGETGVRPPSPSVPPAGPTPQVGRDGQGAAKGSGSSRGAYAYPSSSSLYDTLGREGAGAGATPVPPGRREQVAPDRSGTEPRRYHFRGDAPEEAYDPAGTASYRYRPLTGQERERLQATPGWRPLDSSRQGSAPPGPPFSEGSPPPWSNSPDYWQPELPGASPAPGPEAETWFDRHYGQRRR